MKKFKIPCDFNGQKVPFDLYIGSPDTGLHPLHFQQEWLMENRSGNIPTEVMNSFQKLQNIATENNVSFEELCMYALGKAAEDTKSEVENTENISKNKA